MTRSQLDLAQKWVRSKVSQAYQHRNVINGDYLWQIEVLAHSTRNGPRPFHGAWCYTSKL